MKLQPERNMPTLQTASIVLCAVCVFVVWGAFAAFRINDPDTMQYLASGREIVRHGFHERCAFTYSTDHCHIAYAEWSFHVLTYGTFRLAGWYGLNALQLLLPLILFGLLLWRLLRQKVSPWIALATLFSIVFIVMDRFMLRADVAVFILAAGLYGLLQTLVRQLDEHRGVRVAVVGCLLTQLLWANVHGSFPLGWLIGGACAGESLLKALLQQNRAASAHTAKVLFAVLAGMIAVSLLNPYGFKAFMWPFTFYFGPAQFHDQLEFQSPFAPADYVRLAVHAYEWLLAFTVLVLLASIRRLRLADVAVLAVFAYLSAKHVRYTALFAVSFAFIIPVYAQHTLAAVQRRLVMHRQRVRQWATVSTIAIILGILGVGGRTVWAVSTNRFYITDQRTRLFGFGLSELSYPAGAAAFVKTNNLSGNMFNDYGSGTYLNWALYPRVRTFIDGHSYTLELLRYYNDVMNGVVPFQTVAEKYHISYVVLNHTANDTQKLIPQLYADPAWALVYADENSVVFLTASEANRAFVDEYRVNFASGRNFDLNRLVSTVRDHAAVSSAWMNRGALLFNLHLVPQAIAQFQKAVEASPSNYVASTRLGIAEYQLGHWEAAMDAYMRAERVEPWYAPLQFNLALAYARQKEWDRAIGALTKALDLNPRIPLAHYVAGAVYEAKGDTEEARRAYEEELRINPGATQATEALARLSSRTSNTP